jgi:hypothetical protein
MDGLDQVVGEPHCERAVNTGAQACERPSCENRAPTTRACGPTRTEIAGVHSDHRRSNPFGLFLNATVRVRVALLRRVLENSSKTGRGRVAMVQLDR